MGFNPCCCWNLKDGCVTIAIWTAVYAMSSLALFGWQLGVLNACRAVTMAQANLQCEYYCPCVGASTYRTSSLIEALFVIQILCLISAFFLLFASVSLIYGIHVNSRFLIWPWFPCMISMILCCLAYCVTWWTGDVRDYWLVLTILEMLSVLINIYCLIGVVSYYRDMINGREFGQYGKHRRYGRPMETVVNYVKDQSQYVAPRRDDQYNNTGAVVGYDPQYGGGYKGFTNYDGPSYPFEQYPYAYEQEQPISAVDELPMKTVPADLDQSNGNGEDMITHWVKGQQQQGVHEHAATEPPSPGHEHQAAALPPWRSVPSMQAEDASHDNHRHRHRRRSGRRRSSHRRHRSHSVDSRSRRSSRNPSSTDDDDDTEYSASEGDYRSRHHRHDRRHKHHHHHSRSRSRDDRYSDSATDDTTGRRGGRTHRQHQRSDDDAAGSKKKSKQRRPRDVKRDDRDRLIGMTNDQRLQQTSAAAAAAQQKLTKEQQQSGGISIPQHIIIPPSSGPHIGPDGKPQSQKFQINSEITISYDNDRHRSTVPSRTNNATAIGGAASRRRITAAEMDDDRASSQQSSSVHHGSTAV